MTRYGIALHEKSTAATLQAIAAAEKHGIDTAWITSGTAEQMMVLLAAALQTRSIRLGTAIIPTYPRHPVLLAQQASVFEALAPTRLRLGVGPSHRPLMEAMFGLPYRAPLSHLREYVSILRQALSGDSVDFDGQHFHVHGLSVSKAPLPIMISALREKAFHLAGEISDGAISWICPASYLRTHARTALEHGASDVQREVPSLIAQVFLCVWPEPERVREDARQRLAIYPRLPAYADMLMRAGLPEAGVGQFNDAAVDALVIHGTQEQCAQKLRAFATEATADEVICSLMACGPNRTQELEEAMQVVAMMR